MQKGKIKSPSKMTMLDHLKEQGVHEKLLLKINEYKKDFPKEEISKSVVNRIPVSAIYYEGTEVWNMAIAAILEGQNILLCGPKATGKNVLAENLAALFERPLWTVSCHVQTDSASLIGSDTFFDGKVSLRPGSIHEMASHGGFAILDEVNMAKNDAVSVLHAALDYRRIIDVPGYQQIAMHPSSRFIGTMNYGYAGTRELNEALVSRFMVIHMPPMDERRLKRIISSRFPTLYDMILEQLAGLFLDLQKKADHGEISTKAVDLRGLLGAIGAMQQGLDCQQALNMGVAGKVFDGYEKEIVEDVIRLRLGQGIDVKDVFKNAR